MKSFHQKGSNVFTINVMSFGFKHGMPIDADLVFDVRFLPNPYYIEELRLKSGLDEEVSSYVLKWSDTKTLIEKLTDLFLFMIPQYKREGKTQLVIAFGCTGGQHRSVTLAEYFGKLLKAEDKTVITHRDVTIERIEVMRSYKTPEENSYYWWWYGIIYITSWFKEVPTRYYSNCYCSR